MRHFTVSSADIARCPYRMLNASHYRVDGSCRCVPGVDLEIEQTYSDGHTSHHTVCLRQPARAAVADGDWWDEVVQQHCGDGHGANSKLGFYYLAKIVGAEDQWLVGKSCEWSGR